MKTLKAIQEADGIIIDNAELIAEVKDSDRIPISDGTRNAKAATIRSIKEHTLKETDKAIEELRKKIERSFDGGTPYSVYGGTRHIDGGNIKDSIK